MIYLLLAGSPGIHNSEENTRREFDIRQDSINDNNDQHSTTSTEECNVEEYLRIIRADRFFHVIEVMPESHNEKKNEKIDENKNENRNESKNEYKNVNENENGDRNGIMSAHESLDGAIVNNTFSSSSANSSSSSSSSASSSSSDDNENHYSGLLKIKSGSCHKVSYKIRAKDPSNLIIGNFLTPLGIRYIDVQKNKSNRRHLLTYNLCDNSDNLNDHNNVLQSIPFTKNDNDHDIINNKNNDNNENNNNDNNNNNNNNNNDDSNNDNNNNINNNNNSNNNNNYNNNNDIIYNEFKHQKNFSDSQLSSSSQVAWSLGTKYLNKSALYKDVHVYNLDRAYHGPACRSSQEKNYHSYDHKQQNFSNRQVKEFVLLFIYLCHHLFVRCFINLSICLFVC